MPRIPIPIPGDITETEAYALLAAIHDAVAPPDRPTIGNLADPNYRELVRRVPELGPESELRIMAILNRIKADLEFQSCIESLDKPPTGETA